MSILIHPAPHQSVLLSHPVVRLAEAVMSLIAAIRTGLRNRRAARDLRELDDHMLADIGLVRSGIAAAVRFGRDGLMSHRL